MAFPPTRAFLLLLIAQHTDAQPSIRGSLEAMGTKTLERFPDSDLR